MFTEQECINMLRRSIMLFDDRTGTQKKFNLKDDDFYPFMCGYFKGDLEFVISHMESKINK